MSKSSEEMMFEHFFGSFPNDSQKQVSTHEDGTPWVHFGNVSVNRITGEVRLPEGIELSDAALSFWKAMRRNAD